MPTPGSHRYDVRRTRLRGKLESEGIPDEHADATANQTLKRDQTAPNPAALDDRAAGPYGGRRAGGGDPGPVIQLRSPSFNDGATMPPRHSHDGGNVSPTLEWDGVPAEAVELVLLCEDPDAPRGTFHHWLVTGMDPAPRGIAEGQEPAGTNWPNDFGETGYGGPRPPVGDDPHRYFFRLFALASPLELRPGAGIDDVRAALEDSRLATGTLTGLFVR